MRRSLHIAPVAALLLVSFAGCDRSAPPRREATEPPLRTGAAFEENLPSTSPGGGLRGATPSAPPLPPGLPALAQAAREFVALTEDERAAMKRLEEEFWSTPDEDRRLTILEEIERSYYGEEVLALAEKILALGNAALSERVLAMLAGNMSAAILPLLDRALRDPAEPTRLAAVTAVTQVRNDAVVGFLGKVFADGSASVRLAGLNVLDDQTENRQLKILREAIRAPHPDVQESAITMLQLESNPRSVEVIFEALDAADPEVRRGAQFSLEFLLDREFTTAAEARVWWRENKNKFGDDLAPEE